MFDPRGRSGLLLREEALEDYRSQLLCWDRVGARLLRQRIEPEAPLVVVGIAMVLTGTIYLVDRRQATE